MVNMVIDEEPEGLSHLHPVARRLARLPDTERLGYVRADRATRPPGTE